MYREISHCTGKSIKIVNGPTAHKKIIFIEDPVILHLLDGTHCLVMLELY